MPQTTMPTHTRVQMLTPGMPARFERFRFVNGDAGADGTAGAGDDTNKADGTQGDPADKPLGPNGEKALAAERDARKQLEQTVAQMQQAQKDQTAALAAALGVTPDKKDDGTQILTTLQQQIEEMRRETVVLRVAAAHKITDTDDIDLLKSAKDEDAMGRLAARLAAKADDAGGTGDEKSRRPKPDRSQGGGGTDKTTSVSSGRELFAERRKR